jgi:hypothetical protein
MTTTVVPLASIAGLITAAASTAQSEPGERLAEMQDQIRWELLKSWVIRRGAEQVLDRLEEARIEASTEGWNGYGALPLNPSAYSFAKIFLSALPTTAPYPEVSADPDGEVALDWFFGDRNALTISIGVNGRCTFAGSRGQSMFRGTDWIDDGIPASIVFALGQLAKGAKTSQTR